MTGPFKRGQKVRLISGGASMTYATFRPYVERKWWDASFPMPSGVFCVWLDTMGHKQAEWFAPDLLVSCGDRYSDAGFRDIALQWPLPKPK